MKKIIALTLCLLHLIFLTSCDLIIHIHEYQEIETEEGMIGPPSCTSYGIYRTVCSCGALSNNVFKGTTILDHDLEYVPAVLDSENNILTNKYYQCKNCNRTFDEYGNQIKQLTEVFDHNLIEYQNGIESTCEAIGLVGYYYCNDCNKYFDKDYEEITNLEIKPIGHNYDGYISNNDGTHKRICLNDETHIEINLCNFGDWTITDSKTYKKRTCRDCGYEEIQEFEENHIHEFSTEWTIDIEPTCEMDGLMSKHCLIPGCNETLNETKISSLNHDYSNWNEIVQSSCTTIGEKTRVCNICNKIETKIILPKGHEFITEVYEPTCLEKGYTLHTCQNCPYSYQDNYRDLISHNLVNIIDPKTKACDVSCSSPETYYKTCDVCNQIITSETFTVGIALEHNYQEIISEEYLQSPANCYHPTLYYKSCIVCHSTSNETFEVGIKLEHYFCNVVDDEFLIKEATCSTKAVYCQSCINCKDKLETTFEFGEVANHKYIQNHDSAYLYKEATCTDRASYYESCQYCGLKSNTIFYYGNTLGHDLIHVEAQAPSLYVDGWKDYDYCSKCNYSTKVVLKYKEHDYQEIFNNTKSSDKILYRVEKCLDCNDFKIYDEFDNNISDDLLQYSKLDAYKSFGNIYNSTLYQNNYLIILGKLLRVQVGTMNFTGDGNLSIVFYNPFSTITEAQSCYASVDADWPILFWNTSYVESTNNYINIQVDDSYYDGSTRLNAWKLCVKCINEIVNNATNSYPTDLYRIKYVYNEIIKNIDYAYIKNTKTPDDSTKAHSIYGYFSRYGCVCEGYAKTLQVILNKLGIHTYYINGTVNGNNHAWNYITLNGKIYFADITWDDKEEYTDYEYFLLGSSSVSNMKTRVPASSNPSNGFSYNAVLPNLSNYDYNLVTLANSDNIIYRYYSLEEAVTYINNNDVDYNLYLYDFFSNIQARNLIKFDLGLIPNTCKSVSIIGLGDGTTRSLTSIVLSSSKQLQNDININTCYFRQDSNIFLNHTLYETIDIGNSNLTFNKCSGYMSFNITGNGNVYINDPLTSGNSGDCHSITGTLNCHTLEINNSKFLIMNNINITNLNLNGTLTFIQGWEEFKITNASITNVYPLKEDAYIELRGEASENPIKLNITNVFGTYRLRIDTKFTYLSQIPYISITGCADTYVLVGICGKIDGKYLTQDSSYNEPLLTISKEVWNKLILCTVNSSNQLVNARSYLIYDQDTSQVSFK